MIVKVHAHACDGRGAKRVTLGARLTARSDGCVDLTRKGRRTVGVALTELDAGAEGVISMRVLQEVSTLRRGVDAKTTT